MLDRSASKCKAIALFRQNYKTVMSFKMTINLDFLQKSFDALTTANRMVHGRPLYGQAP